MAFEGDESPEELDAAETLMCMAVRDLQESATGAQVLIWLDERSDEQFNPAQIYETLDNLVDRKTLDTYERPGPMGNAGSWVKIYMLTNSGKRLLENTLRRHGL